MGIDAKSMFCGLVVGAIAITGIAAMENSSDPVGRYQASTGSGFVIILDTQTGKAWGANLAGNPGFQTTHEGFWDKKAGR